MKVFTVLKDTCCKFYVVLFLSLISIQSLTQTDLEKVMVPTDLQIQITPKKL